MDFETYVYYYIQDNRLNVVQTFDDVPSYIQRMYRHPQEGRRPRIIAQVGDRVVHVEDIETSIFTVIDMLIRSNASIVVIGYM